jgi:hypothetical protein
MGNSWKHQHWEAPRIAYELVIEWAQKIEELTVGSGGTYGQIPADRMPTIGKTWHDLRLIEQHDVLAALGAQARSAMWELRKQRQGQPLVITDAMYSPRLCERAAEALAILGSPESNAPWALPACTHCAALVATALIDLQVVAIRATGIADPVYVLQMLLKGTELPAQREPGDNQDAEPE